jgi:hypothetical protein
MNGRRLCISSPFLFPKESLIISYSNIYVNMNNKKYIITEQPWLRHKIVSIKCAYFSPVHEEQLSRKGLRICELK